MWSIIGIFVAFLLVFFLIIRKVNIGISLLLGSVILGLFFLPVRSLTKAILDASVAISTLELVATIASVTFLNVAYHNTGQFEELTGSLREMFPSRGIVAVIPIIFGILPVSGGALFSAPVVDLEGDRFGIEKERKAFLNMWFRHIPHLLYPLETAFIIASYLARVNLTIMILFQIPVFVTGIAIGYLMELRGDNGGKQVRLRYLQVKRFLIHFLPILVAVILTAGFGVKVYISILVGAILLFMRVHAKLGGMRSGAKDVGKMALVAFGIMVFRHIIEISGALDIMGGFVQTYSVWPPISFVFLPLVIGFALGESSPSITLSLSILSIVYEFSPPAACLAYTCMYFGHLISPSHLCFAVTAEYFKMGISQMYKRLIPATIVTLSINIPLMILVM